MKDLTAFKGQIFKYTLIVALIAELGSLPFLKLDIQYTYGLILGTCIAIVNFNILTKSAEIVLQKGNKWISMLSYILRLLIYGFAFYMSMRVSNITGIACVIGFLTIKFAIYYIYGIKTKVNKNVKSSPEAKAYYEELDRMRENHKTDSLIDKFKSEINYQEDSDDDIKQ